MRRPSIDKAALAQLDRQSALLRDVIRSGGKDRWSHLFTHGHRYPTVRKAIRDGYLSEPRPYHYEITQAGCDLIAQLDHAKWTGTAA
jgi:hypothetical protein